MLHSIAIEGLKHNKEVFRSLFSGLPEHIYRWKPAPEKWCLLEIVCHLYDEEKDDFRTRIKHTFETPGAPMPPIDPPQWVIDHKYMEQDYETMLSRFLEEREWSIEWLTSLENPAWKNMHHHPNLGPLSAEKFLANWLAHDYLHFRQITATKYFYLQQHSEESLDYAGNW